MAKEKTSPKLMLGYSFGEIACQTSWYMVNNYLTGFYTDIVGLSAVAISAIMLIARIWDAINDPMMGNIADRTNTRWGKFRPYILFAPPFLAIFNILTFTVFPVQGTAKVILCLICYIGLGMAYTVCSIAYQALQNVIAIDSQVRMNLATARGLGGAVAGIILGQVASKLIPYFSGAEAGATGNAHGYFITTVILSVAMVPLFIACGMICKETYTEHLHSGKAAEKMGFIQSLMEVSKNDQLLMVVLTTILGALCVSGRMGLLYYYVLYVIKGDFILLGNVFSIMTFAQLLGVLLLPFGTKLFTKKGYMIILQLVMCAGFLLMYINTTPSTIYVLVVSFVCGICNSAASICPGLVGDALEYGDWKLGRRQEGIAASMLSFGVKLATAICGSAGILLLSAAGYVANAEQSAATIKGINAVVNLLPFVIGLVSLIPLFFYKLSPKRVEEIRADLEAGIHKYDK